MADCHDALVGCFEGAQMRGGGAAVPRLEKMDARVLAVAAHHLSSVEEGAVAGWKHMMRKYHFACA